jgi:hypothetical protein
MLAKGLAVEKVMQYTGLSLAEVQAASGDSAPPAKKKRQSRAKPAK